MVDVFCQWIVNFMVFYERSSRLKACTLFFITNIQTVYVYEIVFLSEECFSYRACNVLVRILSLVHFCSILFLKSMEKEKQRKSTRSNQREVNFINMTKTLCDAMTMKGLNVYIYCRLCFFTFFVPRGSLVSIFAGYVPLASQSPYPITVYFWSILWPIMDLMLVTFGKIIFLTFKSRKSATPF